MKRFLLSFIVLGLVVGSVATAEAKRTKKPTRVERTVEGNYGPLPDPLPGCEADTDLWACTTVDAHRTEAVFTAKASDALGLPVFVQVVANGRNLGTFCGETTRPMSFDPGANLAFRIEPMPYFWSHWGGDWVGPLDCPYRMSTTGTIRVTLSNMR